MTTIAFDGKTLAADKLATIGNTPFLDSKIEKVKWQGRVAHVGYAGTVRQCMPIIEALKIGEEIPVILESDLNFSIVLVTSNGQVFYFCNSVTPDYVGDRVKFAAGSGGDFALGAMHAGKNAIEAVEIASTLDIHSGYGVDSVTIK